MVLVAEIHYRKPILKFPIIHCILCFSTANSDACLDMRAIEMQRQTARVMDDGDVADAHHMLRENMYKPRVKVNNLLDSFVNYIKLGFILYDNRMTLSS